MRNFDETQLLSRSFRSATRPRVALIRIVPTKHTKDTNKKSLSPNFRVFRGQKAYYRTERRAENASVKNLRKTRFSSITAASGLSLSFDTGTAWRDDYSNLLGRVRVYE